MTKKPKPTTAVNDFEAAGKAMELYHIEPDILQIAPVTLKRIELDAQRLKTAFPTKPEVVRAADAILFDIDHLRRLEAEVRGDIQIACSIAGSNPDVDLLGLLDTAATIGVRWAATMRKVGWPKGAGKNEAAEWQFIRAEWQRALKASKKPNRPEVIEAGLRQYEQATGSPSKRSWSDFIPHFRERVID